MTVFELVKLSEYDPERHVLPIAHDNLRIADAIWMIVHPASGEMYLSWHDPYADAPKHMRGQVFENANKNQSVKVLAFTHATDPSSQYIWAHNKAKSDNPVTLRHPQLSRQQMADQLDHAFKELEEWDEMIKGIMNPELEGIEILRHSAHVIGDVHDRIKSLIERLSEYK